MKINKAKNLIISVFKKDTIKKYYRPENKKDRPIFVLGMPRSGTSLVEQIIASHSEVHGAGEINYIDNIIKKYFTFEKKLFHSSTINKENFLAAGIEYMKKINKLSVEKKICNKQTAAKIKEELAPGRVAQNT